MRELITYLTTVVVILVPFFGFVALGWPGDPDPCITDSSPGRANTCFCEEFDPSEVGDPGVRQPFNTFSNLYSILTGGFLAAMIYHYRRRGLTSGPCRMRSTSFYPLCYLVILIFLGLGSMWFHASLVAWGGVFDQLSMYTFANFLWFYTLVRITNLDLVFYIGYPAAVVLCTVVGALGVPSFVVISGVVAVYVFLEAYIAFGLPGVRAPGWAVGAFYVPALVSFGLAFLVWALSQTDGALCNGGSSFQWHGVWHWLAGGTALCLYFYWRHAPR